MLALARRASKGGSVLRVAIDARFPSGLVGGIEQVLIGLASGFAGLDGGDEYVFLTLRGQHEWLEPYVRRPCRIVQTTEPPFTESYVGRLKRRVPGASAVAQRIPAIRGLRRPGPPPSDGTVERLGADVVHFTSQRAFITDVPTIYQPHDLQHVHLPESFTPREAQFRDASYRLHCQRAALVVVMSEWGRFDITKQYELPPTKVQVIPWAPVLDVYPPLEEGVLATASRRFDLPDRFLFYPARTWPHKNHVTLLEALAILRDERGLAIPLVCSGSLTDFYPRIKSRVEKLKLQDQVRFLGFVNPSEVQALYRAADCLVFPSKFEGFGMPVLEAFSAGTPVVCSDATCLAEVSAGAALLCRPEDPEEIADAIYRVWNDAELRDALSSRGLDVARSYTWERTARSFHELYRAVAAGDCEDGFRPTTSSSVASAAHDRNIR